MKLLILLLIIVFLSNSINSYKTINKCNYSNKVLYFNRGNNDNDNNDGNIFKSILRYIPGLSRARIEKSYETEVEDTGNRYMIRLIMKPGSSGDRRHTITRIQRYFPDIVYATAEDIVDTALVDGIALIRIVNSRNDAETACDMLRKAMPPIYVDVFDNRKNEIIDI